MPGQRDPTLWMAEYTIDVRILAIDLAKPSFEVCGAA
jgi:hypothetical protein